MVDLAKIRKKAKKKVDGGQLTVDEAPLAQIVDEAPIAPESASSTVNREPSTPSSALSKLEAFKATAGQRRVAVRAETVELDETVESTQLELLTFVIAGEQYAVEIERIVEIVTPRPVTRVPNADPSIVGIISLRGTIVTLVDVRRKLKHPDARTAAADPRMVVVEQHGETIGFEVDRVLRVIKMERTAVEPHPVVHISEQDESIRGVFRQAGALTILLDFDKLLDGRSLAASA
jgi:purine-binding chemotaxis protein CheW